MHLLQGTAEPKGIQDFLSSWNDLASNRAEREMRGSQCPLSLSYFLVALGGTNRYLFRISHGWMQRGEGCTSPHNPFHQKPLSTQHNYHHDDNSQTFPSHVRVRSNKVGTVITPRFTPGQESHSSTLPSLIRSRMGFLGFDPGWLGVRPVTSGLASLFSGRSGSTTAAEARQSYLPADSPTLPRTTCL